MSLIITVIALGVVAAAAKIVLLMRLGQLRRLMALHWVLDLAAGAAFAFLFGGTLTGMLIAAIAGLTFSAFVTVYRKIVGYETLRLQGCRPVWVRVGP